MASSVKVLSEHNAVSTADGHFGFEFRVTDSQDPFVDVEIVGDDSLLARGFAGRDFNRRNRMRDGVGQLSCSIPRAIPTEEPFNDVHLCEEVGDAFQMWVPFHVPEQNRIASVQVLLHPGDLQVRIHGRICFKQIPRCPQPLDHAPQ